jgi:hypothetical protein
MFPLLVLQVLQLQEAWCTVYCSADTVRVQNRHLASYAPGLIPEVTLIHTGVCVP